MSDLKFKEIIENNHKYLSLKCNSYDTVEYQIKMLNYNKELPLIPIELFTMNGVNTMSYEVTDLVNLFNYIYNTRPRREIIINILSSIVFLISNIESYFLKVDNILFNEDYIFFDSISKEVKLIYVPFKMPMENKSFSQKMIILNLLDAIKSSGIMREDLNDCIMKVRDDFINIEELKEFLDDISKERPLRVESNIKDKAVKDKKRFLPNFLSRKKNIDNNRVDDKVESTISEGFTLNILDDLNNRSIYLEKNIYLIGRLEGSVDIVLNSSSVGRVHGRIEKGSNDTYYYEDLGSKNGSFINGERLIPNRKYHIISGNEIRLANINMYLTEGRG
ncbi:DUF6382 domain-containing protein [Clostridium sp. MB05]